MSHSEDIKSKLFRQVEREFDDSLFDQEIDLANSNAIDSKFDPSQFFIPGWRGEGLVTNHGLQIKAILNNLTIDATSLFKKLCASTYSMKRQTYEEFLAYARYCELDISAFSQQNDFWFHFQDDSSPFQEHIQKYIRLFCFRAVSIYLFRIKFILDISKELNLELSEDTLFNPLSFLGRIFKKNSSTELECESLQINQYSWYRPTKEYKESLIKLQDAFSKVTLTELIKLLSTPKDSQVYSLKNYSHSLSHLSFGLFINDLLIKFPKWFNAEKEKTIPSFFNQKTCILPTTINTQFEGNHISSMALSHWLAQESSMSNSQWSNIICPNFNGDDFIDGTFLKICQELQFLSFLTKIAIEHKYEVVPFICKIMREKNSTSASNSFDQISLIELTDDRSAFCNTFNRIVLNLIDSPKTNPHHHLVTQILNKKKSLKKDGVLVVLSNQKLFVPSHSERVELLLKDFKLKATFILDELQGKGEIPQFLYVFTAREEGVKASPHLFKVNRQEKESCLTFQFKGNLTRFNKFNKFVDEFQYFLKNKKVINTPIYVNELEKNITFEFHTDAIIEGKLVSLNSNSENGQMTHPAFFKNLTKTSVSLDTFFHMDHLNPSENLISKNIPNELLGVKTSEHSHYPLLLIVNQLNPLKIELELVPSESFKARVEENGTAFFTYFGMTPKHTSINLNVFREYFNSKIGFQIIQMQLSDGPRQLKGKLKALLVPTFFAKTQFMPTETMNYFSLLEKDSLDLLKLHPEELNLKFNLIEEKLANLKGQYAWHVLGLFSHFKLNLLNSITDFESSKVDSIQFSNPVIAKELMKLKTYNIYPKNKDIFVNIESISPSDLQLPLSSVVFRSEEDNYSIILSSNNKKVISIYSSEKMVLFIKFILQNAIGVKISDIMVGLSTPTIEELESVILKFSSIKDNKIMLLKKTESIIAKIFQDQVIL